MRFQNNEHTCSPGEKVITIIPDTLYPKTGVFVLPGALQNRVMEVGPTFVRSLRLGRRGSEEYRKLALQYPDSRRNTN